MEVRVSYAITLDFGDADERCSSYPIYDEEFFLAVPSGHRLATKESITRMDLASEAFLIPETALP